MLSTLLTTILVINELMASNAGEVLSPAINFDSWIELYNPTDSPVNLGGMYLTDDEENLQKWQLPADMGTVPAKGYKVVWLGSNEIKDNQAPFHLDCDGGYICLSNKDGEVVASMTYPAALSRTAWARTTDGGEDWGWTSTPTPEATNATAVFAEGRLAPPVVDKGSTLFTNSLSIKVDIPEGTHLMYTTDGSLPTAPKADEEEVSPWTDYIINGDCEGTQCVSLITRNADGNGDEYVITDGAGYNGSRGIKVHSTKNAANDYSAQLFVYTPDHVWQSGEKYRFRMKVRADKAARMSAQTHSTPHNYISGSILDGNYNVTNQWQEITYEGQITDQQTGSSSWWGQSSPGTMQTIAFNLNVDRQDNYFYFDEVSWELYTGDSQTVEASKESKDGVFNINNTTSLTFRLFKDGCLPSVPVTRSYIKTNNKYTLPIISIVGDKKYFTDPKIGFDCDGDGTNGKTGNGQNQPKNYNQDWDRPVNFSFISTDGEMLFNQDVNICASGGYTRSQRYRSFKLKSNKIFDGQNRFDYAFFPQKPYIRSRVLLIRNGGNDIWEHNARFMDPALETIIQRSGIDVDVQSYVPIIEYVNGELRGVLNMREPNNDKFAYANWGYDDEELDAFENMTMKNGDDVAINRIFELGKQINAEGAYDELKTLLDIDEFTNYMAVTLFLYNDDWPDNNIKAYRSRKDGRYRFVSFDLDYAFKGCWDNSDENPFTNFAKFKDDNAPRTSYNKDIVNLFLNLLGHDGYRRKFIDTFSLMGGSVFEPTRSTEIVNELLDKVKDMCQLMKQQGINDGHDPDRAATTIKNNLNGRSKKMADYLKAFSYAKLNNSAQSVTLTTNVEGAHLFINDLDVPYADFQGHLFAPVTLRAEAPAGYQFAGWKNGSTIVSYEAEMNLPSSSNVNLTATFTKLSDDELAAQGITPIRINEVSADDGIYVNDYFKRKDWVELYNTTDQDIDAEGMFLTDNPEKPEKYQIGKSDSQASTIVPAHGYLIIWCDKESPLSQLHAPFKLAKEGDELMLTAADKSWRDHFTYAAHSSDQTVGRYPDGAADVYLMNVPTIAKANIFSSYLQPVEQPDLTGVTDLLADDAARLDIRYAEGNIYLRSSQDGDLQVHIVNFAGQTVETLTASLSGGTAVLAIDHLPAGTYIAHVGDGKGRPVSVKFIK